MTPAAGAALPLRRADSGIQRAGLMAERIISMIGAAAEAKQGELELCSEYGRVEVTDSDDHEVRVQIRLEAVGAGAVKALEDTTIKAHLTVQAGLLRVAVWHTTQGFTPSSQPCLVGIRLQLPRSGRYRIAAVANHGGVTVRNLVLSGGRLEGLVGWKVKGIKGYQGGHDIAGVALAGDLELVLAGGVPGSGMLSADVRAIASCKLRLRTDDGEIRVSITPDPSTGIQATARSREGALRVGLGRSDAAPLPGGGKPTAPQHGGELSARTDGYESMPVRLEVDATSSTGNVTVVSSM